MNFTAFFFHLSLFPFLHFLLLHSSRKTQKCWDCGRAHCMELRTAALLLSRGAGSRLGAFALHLLVLWDERSWQGRLQHILWWWGCLCSNKLLFHTEDDSACLEWIIFKLDRLKNKARKMTVHRANFSGQDEQAGMFWEPPKHVEFFRSTSYALSALVMNRILVWMVQGSLIWKLLLSTVPAEPLGLWVAELDINFSRDPWAASCFRRWGQLCCRRAAEGSTWGLGCCSNG